jgi:iron-sulfur cluster assembly protein
MEVNTMTKDKQTNEKQTISKEGPITKDLTIGSMVKKYPQIVPTLMSFGVHCVGCHVAEFETLEQGLMGHGFTAEKVDEAIVKLNEAYAEAKKDAPASTCGSEESLSISDAAVEKVKELMEKEGKPGMALRIEVIPGGCSGMTYDFSFDEKQNDDDQVIEKNGLKVFIDEASLDYIKGSTVDFVETLHESGFKIENPNAKAGCGCGKSFS